MKFLLIALLIGTAVIVFLAVMAAKAKRQKQPTDTKKPDVRKKELATANEQKMFWRLCEAFPAPETLVFTQVAFGALIAANKGSPRGFFDKKIADFVVTRKTFEVMAVIELDDSSHNDKQESDEARDKMLQSAGYKTLRYKAIPSAEKLKSDIEAATVVN